MPGATYFECPMDFDNMYNWLLPFCANGIKLEETFNFEYLKTKLTVMKRNATAVWKGTGKEGKGTLSTQSGTLSNTQYSYKSRFEEGTGTNPEELIGAAHAGCFSMKLSFVLQEAGFTARLIGNNSRSILGKRRRYQIASYFKGKNFRHQPGTV